MRRVLWLGVLTLAATLKTPAQITEAVLTGTVGDATGAVIAGAVVKAENVKTGVVQETRSNEAGVYLFASLQPGAYRVTAEMQGFQRYVYNEVALEVGARLNLNFALEVGSMTQSVEVTATSENLLGYLTSSVGGMVTGQKVTDLPIPARDALSLVYIHAGLVGDNFSGARIGTLNISVDGINVQDNRINSGVSSSLFNSTDRIEEFRVITSPVDAELGRGSGQIQMVSRSGGNEFHGSAFWSHRNTVLTANSFFNNLRGRDPVTGELVSPRDTLIRNQFGGRVGGPIRQNRTFFHVLYDGQRQRRAIPTTATTFTEPARRGVFRFYPGALNQNALGSAPSVDLSGNPVRPRTATGDLQAASLFGRDPNRLQMDRTGVVKRLLDLTPLPNDFRSGDGLNTAGYRWRRGRKDDRDQYNIRLDHHFSSNHRASFSYTRENSFTSNSFMPQPFPDSPGGENVGQDRMLSLTATSSLRPNVLNELRIGALRPRLRFYAPWEVAGTELQPRVGAQPYVVDFSWPTDPLNLDNDPQGRITPVYQIADSLTWLRGRHAFKWGGELRFVSTNGFNSFDVMPRAVIGTGGATIQNISDIPGISRNLSNAQRLLNDLSGSLIRARQAFNSPGGANPAFLPGEGKQRTWTQREFSLFIKDDFKLRPSLTLNLGLRYEWYGVPYDANGKTTALVGGSAGAFGISGSSFADMFQPGLAKGSLTQVQLIGPRSPNPNLKLYANDNNNFAPAVGLSWSLPWFGKDKTVLRLGYGLGYERNALRLVDVVAGDLPGLRALVNFTSSSYLDLSNMRLPLTPAGKPLEVIPLTDRSQTSRSYDSGLRNPYVQNWNFAIQRALTPNTILEVRYVGNKGTRLVRGISVNDANIFETGILEAFRLTQAGGHAPLFDQLFRGLNVSGLGVVDGQRITGSDVVRFNSTWATYLATHEVGDFAENLSQTDVYTGTRGGLLRRAGLPENWVVVNPQFASSRITSNFASSTYNSLQVEVIKRAAAGWTFQGNYTWSKALGEEEGAGQEMNDSFRNPRNWSMDKRLMSYHLTHVFRNNAIWELPFGPGRRFGGNTSGWLARLIERWQFGTIFNLFSGSPVSARAYLSTYSAYCDDDGVPNAMTHISKGLGTVKRTGNGVIYFEGLQQVADPSIQSLTTLRGIRDQSNLMAIADSTGSLLLTNPTPGYLGSLGLTFFEGPGSFRLDLNLLKRVQIREGQNLEFRIDAIDATNMPQFGDPNADINSASFGRITSASGNRIVVVGLRFNF